MYVCLLVNPTASRLLNVQIIVANPGKFSLVTVPGMTSMHPTLCRFVSPSRTPLEDALSPPRQGASAISKITVSLASTPSANNQETIVVHTQTKQAPESKKQLSYTPATSKSQSTVVQMSVHKPIGTLSQSTMKDRSPQKSTSASSLNDSGRRSPAKLKSVNDRYYL